ncbi:MAG TPA: DUF2191 domain-containing protein [Thermoanaerobaculia bacterium]|nr:DUF2191 domain-containing protein [Thermoanaerobaculia bacterium]
MRTTLTLDDALARELREIAHRSGKPFKHVVNEAIRRGLHASRPSRPPARPYRVEPVSMGGPLPGIRLDKALRLSDALEDDETVREIEMRK